MCLKGHRVKNAARGEGKVLEEEEDRGRRKSTSEIIPEESW